MPKHTMKPMKKSEHDKYSKAVAKGLITQKQHDKLPKHLLDAIVKSKSSKSKK